MYPLVYYVCRPYRDLGVVDQKMPFETSSYYTGPLRGLENPSIIYTPRVSGAILLRPFRGLENHFILSTPGFTGGYYIGPLQGLENPSIIYTPQVSGGYFITPLQGLVIIYSVNPRFRRGSFLCFEILLTGSPEEQSKYLVWSLKWPVDVNMGNIKITGSTIF